MVEVTAASISKRSSGNQIKVTASLTDVQNTYTWTVPYISKIEDISLVCTTSAALGATLSGNVVTFAAGSTLAANIAVYGR